MNRMFLCSILPLLLVVQSKKYLVEVDDGGHLKNMRFSNKNQNKDKVSDEVSDEVKEEFLEEDIEETVIESRGKNIISI